MSASLALFRPLIPSVTVLHFPSPSCSSSSSQDVCLCRPHKVSSILLQFYYDTTCLNAASCCCFTQYSCLHLFFSREDGNFVSSSKCLLRHSALTVMSDSLLMSSLSLTVTCFTFILLLWLIFLLRHSWLPVLMTKYSYQWHSWLLCLSLSISQANWFAVNVVVMFDAAFFS